MKLAVVGAGAWGTALAICFAARHSVTLIARTVDDAAAIQRQRENVRYLPGCALPPALQVTADVTVLAAADLVLIATPVAGLRATVAGVRQQAPAVPVLWACKGLEAESGLLPHQVVAAVHPDASCGVLSGPSFAAEVARGLPAAVVLASADATFARDTAQALHGATLRVYASDDLIGVEVGGAVKNVLAIATGICDGLGLGFNARAALMTRGLAEITRLGVALGARRETFMGLAGVGDLILTCTGELSRNRRVGLEIAAGKLIDQISRELGHVAEGVPAAKEVFRNAQALGVDMPITEAVLAVIQGRLLPRQAVEQLMARDARTE